MKMRIHRSSETTPNDSSIPSPQTNLRTGQRSRPLVRISIVTCWLSDISAIVLFIHLYLALILVRLSLGIAIILWC